MFGLSGLMCSLHNLIICVNADVGSGQRNGAMSDHMVAWSPLLRHRQYVLSAYMITVSRIICSLCVMDFIT